MVGPSRHLNSETNLGKGTATAAAAATAVAQRRRHSGGRGVATAAAAAAAAAEACGSVTVGNNLEISDACFARLARFGPGRAFLGVFAHSCEVSRF